MRQFVWRLCWGICAVVLPIEAARAAPFSPRPAVRRPAAMALADDDRLLLVANQQSGTISVLETATETVVAEHPLGQKLSDLKSLPDGRLLAVDEERHEMLLLSRTGTQLETVSRTKVSPYPVSVAVSADGQWCCVASLWSRRLSIVAIDASQGEPLRVIHSLRLPFAPRKQVLVDDDARLIVADSFGGRLAIVDPRQGKLLAVRELPGHNIRGLAWDARRRQVLAAHQIVNSLAETSENDIHWGIVLINVLRWLPLDRVLDAEVGILTDSHVHPTGDLRSAGGDPAGLVMLTNGTVLLAVAGTRRLAFGQEHDYALQSIPVGARPTAVVAARDGHKAYVANTNDDSISVVDLPIAADNPRTVSLGPQSAPDLVEQGERLFYDARLSLNGWFSCHSCHTDGHTCGELVDNQGDGSFGAAKSVLSLLGTGETGPWAWNGTVDKLEEQVQNSLVSTMQGELPDAATVSALSAYLRSLAPPPPLRALEEDQNKESAIRGEKVFAICECAACHKPNDRYTSNTSYDVGLADRLGNRHFNPPSLQGVSQRASFFHDNRAKSLLEVFRQFRHGLSGDLPAQDVRDLVEFLENL